MSLCVKNFCTALKCDNVIYEEWVVGKQGQRQQQKRAKAKGLYNNQNDKFNLFFYLVWRKVSMGSLIWGKNLKGNFFFKKRTLFHALSKYLELETVHFHFSISCKKKIILSLTR